MYGKERDGLVKLLLSVCCKFFAELYFILHVDWVKENSVLQVVIYSCVLKLYNFGAKPSSDLTPRFYTQVYFGS